MKKILVMFLALVMAVSMLACASAATELKWASVHPPEQVVTQMMMRAIDEINEKAEGIHITGYPNGVLGGSSDVVEGVQEGMVEIITEFVCVPPTRNSTSASGQPHAALIFSLAEAV